MSSVSNSENLSPQVLRVVAKQLHSLQSEPPEGIKVFINDGDLTDIQATIEGPSGTPYEGGAFKMKLVLGKDFPQSPPRGFFSNKDISSKCIKKWRNLCQYAEERLESRFGN